MAPLTLTPEELRQLIAAVAAEDRGTDLDGVILHDHGWENVVLETRDGWILRFPRGTAEAYERELAVLERLQGRFSIPIPRVEWTGAKTRFAAYRMITGARFDDEAYHRAPTDHRERVADSIAQALAEMHSSLSVEDAAALGVPPVDHGETLRIVQDGMAAVPREHYDVVAQLAERFTAIWVGSASVDGSEVVLHNDFHSGNMVFSASGDALIGLWDFSVVQVGAPSFDLRYFDDESPDLLYRVAAAYERRTGRPINVPAAIVANRMEEIQDSLELGRPESIPGQIARWDRTGWAAG